jgi:hypothetical protein
MVCLRGLRVVRVRVRGGVLTVAAADRRTLLSEAALPAGPPSDVPVPAPVTSRLLSAAAGELAVALSSATGQRVRVAGGRMAVEAAVGAGLGFSGIAGLAAREDAATVERGAGPFDAVLSPRVLARMGDLLDEGCRCAADRLGRVAPARRVAQDGHAQVAVDVRIRLLLMPGASVLQGGGSGVNEQR